MKQQFVEKSLNKRVATLEKVSREQQLEIDNAGDEIIRLKSLTLWDKILGRK